MSYVEILMELGLSLKRGSEEVCLKDSCREDVGSCLQKDAQEQGKRQQAQVFSGEILSGLKEKKIFTIRTIKHWNNLLREGVKDSA